jgi:hypothetical protein
MQLISCEGVWAIHSSSIRNRRARFPIRTGMLTGPPDCRSTVHILNQRDLISGARWRSNRPDPPNKGYASSMIQTAKQEINGALASSIPRRQPGQRGPRHARWPSPARMPLSARSRFRHRRPSPHGSST